jgi:hypothetical protein
MSYEMASVSTKCAPRMPHVPPAVEISRELKDQKSQVAEHRLVCGRNRDVEGSKCIVY